MDAVKYLKEVHRMCETITNCDKCPFGSYNNYTGCHMVTGCMEVEDPSKCVSIVEEWSAKNPVKTRQSEFLKIFPNVKINDNTGVIDFCPIVLGEKMNCCKNGIPRSCTECEKEYWLTEIKD